MTEENSTLKDIANRAKQAAIYGLASSAVLFGDVDQILQDAYASKTKQPHEDPKQLDEYKLREATDIMIINQHYDPCDDLKSVEHQLDWSFQAKPMFSFNRNSEENAARVDAWYESRLAEIAKEEQAYRQRLEDARKSGAIGEDEYMKATMEIGHPLDIFDRARQEAREIYLKER